MKYSKQREEIFSYIQSVCTHPTAEQIYHEVKKVDKNISLGTIYRNLEKLSNDKKILRIKIAGKKDRFDGNMKPHYHAICRNCEKITDIWIGYLDEIDQMVKQETNLEIVFHEMIFHTICCHCKKEEREDILWN